MKNKKSLIRYAAAGILTTVFLVFLDQWTKYLAVLFLKDQDLQLFYMKTRRRLEQPMVFLEHLL